MPDFAHLFKGRQSNIPWSPDSEWSGQQRTALREPVRPTRRSCLTAELFDDVVPILLDDAQTLLAMRRLDGLNGQMSQGVRALDNSEASR
jgi:hypothetical protein